MQTPDVLVLGGGGVLGEAWMSAVLAGMGERRSFDARGCSCFVGTSAGSIVAASLTAGIDPGGRLGRASGERSVPSQESGERLTALRQAFGAAAEFAGGAAAPLASLAFASTATGGAMLRRAVLRGVPRGRRSLAELGAIVERTGVSWDGRLRIAAVDLDSGRRVIFGEPDAPALSVAAAVQASCAIPGVFRPVLADGRSYVDGGAWSPTNMDAAIVKRGARVLCLNPTGSLRPFGPVSRGAAASEALVLRNRGAVVTAINPDQASARAMGTNLMDPRRRRAVIDAGVAQGRRLSARAQARAA